MLTKNAVQRKANLTVADLMNVDDALAHILAHMPRLNEAMVSLFQAQRRILARDVHAPHDLPPFDNSAMDGYAVRADDLHDMSDEKGIALRVTQDIPAGHAPRQTLQPGEAARIMTGAPMPPGADAVIPVEDSDSDWASDDALPERVTLFKTVEKGANVRRAGENIRQGELVLSAGRRLAPADLGMLAALGVAEVPVRRRARVVVLTTGDELVSVHARLTPGKIRDANSITLAALLDKDGAEAILLPIAPDDLDAVRQLYADALAQEPDLIISSGGVSVGAADYVRTVLEEMGSVNVWRINLRPGKPLAFGQLRGVPFFGLPGNPVSAAVTYHVLVRPALMAMSGETTPPMLDSAVTAEDMTSDGRRSFIRVTLKRADAHGELVATTTGTQSSGALMSMVLADGLLIIPEGVRHVPAGTRLQLLRLR